MTDNLLSQKNRPNILIADDDQSTRELLFSILKDEYNIFIAKDGVEAVDIVKNRNINVALLDIKMPNMDGLEALTNIKEINEKIEVIMITVIKEIPTAVKAIKNGAYNYINKDFDYNELKNTVRLAIEKQSVNKELFCLKSEIQQLTNTEFLIGKSHKMKSIHEIMKTTAKLPATILILGESGTGKELVARNIHKMSHLSHKPFVTVNLAAIPDDLVESTLFGHERGSFTGAVFRRCGKFELADGGTLFLDEIGELKYELQSKLLRFLQEGEVERIGAPHSIYVKTRLITATNVDLEKAVKDGKFRKDLYYRLNVVPLKLPLLKERKEDIPDLVNLFLKRYCKKFNKPLKTISKQALNVLVNQEWPGNIRELENFVERMVATSKHITINEYDLPMEYQIYKFQENTAHLNKYNSIKEAADNFERNFIIKMLDNHSWHYGKTSSTLGIHRKTLEYKIKKYKIKQLVNQQQMKPKI